MFCQNCGNKLNDNTRFCGGCGNSVGQAQPQQNQNQFAPPPQYQQQPFQQQQSYAPQYGGNAMRCYHHSSKQAVASCSECGKGICKDCYDSYGAGMGAGKALCFDCTEALVQENSAEIAAFRKILKFEWIAIAIGSVIGLIAAISIAYMHSSENMGGRVDMRDPDFLMMFLSNAFMFGWIGLGFGSSIGRFIKSLFTVGLVGAFFWFFVSGMCGPIMPLVRILKRRRQIKKCEKILANDAQVLQEMRDYFAYTQAMEENAGVNLATLANKGGALFGNKYASAVMSKGEKAAQEELRQGVVQIAANGEIIRSFDKTRKKKNKAA